MTDFICLAYTYAGFSIRGSTASFSGSVVRINSESSTTARSITSAIISSVLHYIAVDKQISGHIIVAVFVIFVTRCAISTVFGLTREQS